MDVKSYFKIRLTKLSSTKTCREYWSVLYYWAIGIQGFIATSV